MPHPLYGILMRLLGSEQCGFDVTALEHWPPGSWPQGEDDAGSDSGHARQPSEASTRDPE